MHGNFEQGKSTYPFAYLYASLHEDSTPRFRIVDMRTLENLKGVPPVTQNEAVRISHALNEAQRAGKFKDDSDRTLASQYAKDALHQLMLSLIVGISETPKAA